MNPILLFALVSLAAGGIIWVFAEPILSGERKAEQRKLLLTKRAPRAPAAVTARLSPKARRENVEESLRELEARRARARSVTLTMRIAHAGLSLSKRQFILFAASLGIAAFLAFFWLGTGLAAALAAAFAAGCGVPLWLLNFLKKRRQRRFIGGFPDAIDVIVRGIKAGLPLHESLKVISAETPEPLKSEFRTVVETQSVGVSIGEACNRLYERMPVAEANFFGIVVTIQQKSGGNLSEALSNLGKVLRDRKKMKAKIQAMSMEAKASAAIIAALPVAVMILIYLTSPQYIELLWIHPTGRMMLVGSAIWMSIGVLVMRKMINFDF
ncbi:MAG TPA: type II secretion system F family protein [Xanthobacteraceae bacterium]|jgi:tight adherence protein B